MNNDEKMNALKQGLTLIFGMLTVVAPQLATAEQYSTLTTAIMTIVPAGVALYSVGWSIYAHWGMKKVKENATAIILPATANGAAPPPVGSTINLTPLQGAVKVVGALLIGFILMSLVASSAMAEDQPRRVVSQPKQEPVTIVAAATPTPAVDKSVEVFPCLTPPLIDLRPACNSSAPANASPQQKTSIDLWNKIVGAAAPDIDYAIKLAANAAKGTQSGVTSAAGMRLACLTSIQTLNNQSTGASLVGDDGKPLKRPTPSLFTDAETMMEILDAVQPGGPLWTSCSGAAQLAATSVVAFINALLAGAAGVAALAPK